AGAHYLATELEKTGRMRLAYPGKPYLNEFEMIYDGDLDMLIDALADEGILGGVKTPDGNLLIAVTEMQSAADMDRYVDIVNNL
ncbi:MAG: glycine dehydrogenase, partial [Muribaculaceae bacterium]|nr:glycine dehydrogenase [Muribaculaceae bacterium]